MIRVHVVGSNELESFRRFIAANGGTTICTFQETKGNVTIAWRETDRIDVTDFPTWRMI